MATRKVKDAIDISTNEPIYFLGHAKATYMSDGTTVEDAINNINQSGNGGEGSSSNGNAYPLVNYVMSGLEHPEYPSTINPNTFYLFSNANTSDGSVIELTIEFGPEIAGVANEYIFQFTSGSEPPTLILPDSIKFNSDFSVEANKIYQISILNGLGTVMSWDI
jgi:hypothetical protein